MPRSLRVKRLPVKQVSVGSSPTVAAITQRRHTGCIVSLIENQDDVQSVANLCGRTSVKPWQFAKVQT